MPDRCSRRAAADDRQERVGRSVYGSFPGTPSIRRVLTGGDLAVVEASVDYGDAVDWRAFFVFELRGWKIATATAYWARPFEPAESRAESIERMDG